MELLDEAQELVIQERYKEAIMNRLIIVFLGILVFYGFSWSMLSCSISNKSDSKNLIEVTLSDSFVHFLDSDEGGLETVKIVLKFFNASKDNLYLDFDNLLKDYKENVDFYLTVDCIEHTDNFRMNLAFVTYSKLLLKKQKSDTIAFQVHFKELREYSEKCAGVNAALALSNSLNNDKFDIFYNVKNVPENITYEGVTYKPLLRLN